MWTTLRAVIAIADKLLPALARSYIPWTQQQVLLLLSIGAEKGFECFLLTHVYALDERGHSLIRKRAGD
jgi:hypothetical protein